MVSFIAGILVTCFVLFIGVKAKKLKIEYGDFKEESKDGSVDKDRPGTTIEK